MAGLGKKDVREPEKDPQLEPDFPWLAEPFDPAFFGVDRDPDPPT